MKQFLSDSDRISLKSRHRGEKDRRVADRIKAVLLSDKGWTYRQIAEALFIDEQTISDHVEAYKSKYKLTLSCKGSQGKLDLRQAAGLKAHLENITYSKIDEIVAHVHEKYEVIYTIQGMTNWMHSHGFSYKKPKGTPAKADPKKQAAFVEFYEKFLTETPLDEPILFGDGVHPTMATKVSCGWIKKRDEQAHSNNGLSDAFEFDGGFEFRENDDYNAVLRNAK